MPKCRRLRFMWRATPKNENGKHLIRVGACCGYWPCMNALYIQVSIGKYILDLWYGAASKWKGIKNMNSRAHQKTETWWLIEADSPCIYMAPHGYITSIAWDAYRFLTKDEAQEFLYYAKNSWDKVVGKKEWRICDHLFYV